MEPATLLAFVAVACLLTVTPGADMALVAHTTLARGRRAAWTATLGICAGLAVHAVASSIGLSSLLAKSATAYALVKTAGAVYLIVIGALALRASWRGEPDAPPAAAQPARNLFLTGLLSNVLNPKVALFYLTFLPQFVDPSGNVLAQSLTLAAIHLATGLLWLPLFAWLVDRAGAAFGRGGLKRWMTRATGGVLLAIGAKLLLEKRATA